jgi:hypothetical protein
MQRYQDKATAFCGTCEFGKTLSALTIQAFRICGYAADNRTGISMIYIAPDGRMPFAVIRDTIGKMNMVALGRVVLTRREHVIAFEPKDLLGLTLRFSYKFEIKPRTLRTSPS